MPVFVHNENLVDWYFGSLRINNRLFEYVHPSIVPTLCIKEKGAMQKRARNVAETEPEAFPSNTNPRYPSNAAKCPNEKTQRHERHERSEKTNHPDQLPLVFLQY